MLVLRMLSCRIRILPLFRRFRSSAPARRDERHHEAEAVCQGMSDELGSETSRCRAQGGEDQPGDQQSSETAPVEVREREDYRRNEYGQRNT